MHYVQISCAQNIIQIQKNWIWPMVFPPFGSPSVCKEFWCVDCCLCCVHTVLTAPWDPVFRFVPVCLFFVTFTRFVSCTLVQLYTRSNKGLTLCGKYLVSYNVEDAASPPTDVCHSLSSTLSFSLIQPRVPHIRFQNLISSSIIMEMSNWEMILP